MAWKLEHIPRDSNERVDVLVTVAGILMGLRPDPLGPCHNVKRPKPTFHIKTDKHYLDG